MADTASTGSGIASFLNPLSGIISSVVGLFTGNAEVKKAQAELETAKQALLVAKETTKQSGLSLETEKIKLLEEHEKTAQKALNEQTAIAKNKANVGLLTIVGVLIFLFGVGWLVVKFILPLFYSKPAPAPQSIVLQDE